MQVMLVKMMIMVIILCDDGDNDNGGTRCYW